MSRIRWMRLDATGFIALRAQYGRCYDPCSNSVDTRDMNHSGHSHTVTAARGEPCMGPVCVDPGTAPGLVVGDVNRPAIHIGDARGLHKQFGAAH